MSAAAASGARAERLASPPVRYQVVASPDGGDLEVQADLSAGLGPELTTDPEAAAFVDRMAIFESGRWVPLPAAGGVWRCPRAGCRLRYVFHLRAAARALDDPDTAAERDGALVGPASTWLLRPQRLPAGGLHGRLRVTTTPPLTFVTGLPRVAGAPERVPGQVPNNSDSYDVALLPFFISPYAAFGRFDDVHLQMGGADLELAVATPALDRRRSDVRAWVTAAARAVSAYFGRYPVDHALILAVPYDRGLHGKSLGGGGATVLLQLASDADLGDPSHDWTAAHEMVHLAVPEMAPAQRWLTEGLATYVEPLARAMTGELAPAAVWRDLVLGLPKGLPAPGDGGLDRTHTWGRTYWGGALFAFIADLEIRKATGGRQSLATALRGILQAGGDTRVAWPIQRFLATGDRALERPASSILSDLYHQMAERPVAVDLPAIWQQLGIAVSKDGQVTLDDGAPLAAIRRQMIAATPRP